MSKTKGEGRAPGEKGGRIIDTEAYQRRKRMKEEEKAWAEKSGPVTVKKKEK